jgi:UPF0755 protein
MSFILGTTFNWVILAATIALIYTFMMRGYGYGVEVAETSLKEKSEKEITFTLEGGETSAEVAKKLEDEGVIANAFLFRLENFIKSSDTDYKAGTYLLQATMSTAQINGILLNIREEDIMNLEIQEGFTVQNIADYLASKNAVENAETFINACNTHNFNYSFLKSVPQRENRLEGYLYPASYTLDSDSTPDDIINAMLTKFNQVYTPGGEYSKLETTISKSMDEVITIASIIEKEIDIAAEKPKASEVIHNRLKAGMNLNMCSTVLFFNTSARRDQIAQEDLAMESPYNTYINAGLPLGPICNPGKASIEAALMPEKGDSLYFVLKSETTGEHFFTNSAEEFEMAKIEYGQNY